MQVRVCINERCFAWNAERGYEAAVVLKVYKNKALVEYASGNRSTVPFGYIWKRKSTGKRFKSARGDSKYFKRQCDQRYARCGRRLAAVGVCFGHGLFGGDYGRMLANSDVRTSSFFIFNDNIGQWEAHGADPACLQFAGGGNAIARPWQHVEDSAGMPTGFANLEETHHVSFAGEPKAMHTAKEIIDEATNRIVRVLVKHPKKETIYYCVDAVDSTKIGLSIFRYCTGDDVVEYITAKILALPRLVRLARLEGHRL